MISKRMQIAGALTVAVIVIVSYCAYASSHAFDLKGESKVYTIPLVTEERTLEAQLETYMGGDPTRLIEFILVNPDVERVYILFRASEIETDNPHLLKASASLGEGLGIAIGKGKLNIIPEDVIPREITWFQKVLIYSGFMGTQSEPVVFFKTPNVGGVQDRIITSSGIVIIESSTYENSYILASYVRQLVMA